MPKRPYSECTPTLTDYPRKVQRTERREDDTAVVDILAGVKQSSYLLDGLDIPLVTVDGRRVFGRAISSGKKYGSRLFRVTNPVCRKTPGYTTYIYRSLSLWPFFDSKQPFNLSGWNYNSQKNVSTVKIEMKIPHYYYLPRNGMDLILYHQVAQHKVDAKAEREICDVLLIAAENPEIYPLPWMTAMKVALLYKPFEPQAVLNAIARATRRHVRHAKAMAVTNQEQFQALCDELLVGAVFCEAGDKRQAERKHVLRIVGERMKRKADVDTIIADANVIMKFKSTSSAWVKHVDDDEGDIEMSTVAHESSFSDSNPEAMAVEDSSQTPINNDLTSSTADSHAALLQSSGTGVSLSMGSATNTRVEVPSLGTWARRPLASLRADYARVELIIGSRENHVYKTTTRVTSAKTWRAHQAEIAQSLDDISGGSELWRGSPLKSSHTPDSDLDGRDDDDDDDAAAEPSARPMPKRTLMAENNAMARLYYNIWRKSLAAIEAEVSSRERVWLTRISEQGEAKCDAMEL